jgi:DNA-binding transcriptional MerR regulator
MEPTLLSIGAFARLTGLSVPTLRRYDAIGLLRPASVDGATGYRRYVRGQVAQARTIRRLRDLDVPLETIRAILDAGDGEALSLLERHRDRLDRTHDRLRRGPALLLERKRTRLDHAAAQLRALSPLATLERGYAIVRRGDELVRSAQAVDPGDAIAVQVADGSFGARVD